jgi:hypothetical protein
MAIDGDTALALALALPDTEAAPHMDRTAVRVRKGRIFATVAADRASMNVRLTPDDQQVYGEALGGACEPVAGGWGRMGWTTIDLSAVDAAAAEGVLAAAWRGAAPKQKASVSRRARP